MPRLLNPDFLDFWRERHLCTMTILRPDRDEESVREAVERYALRYRSPRPNRERVAIRVTITRVLGNVPVTF